MILQALHQYYQRLSQKADSTIAPPGYSSEKISYEIVLNPAGDVVQVNNIMVTSGKKSLDRVLNVPASFKRPGTGSKPFFLWDKTSYVLGISEKSERANENFASFKKYHLDTLKDACDEGLQALRLFLEKWQPSQFQSPLFPETMRDTNLVFRLDGDKCYLHERPAAQEVRSKLLQTSSDGTTNETAPSVPMCLITGDAAAIERVHPVIKGVSGAQSSGASIVSFQQQSFRSFNKEQGDNAPISEQAAFSYTTALNHLLRRGEDNRQRIQIGDSSVVFWAQADSAQQAQDAEDWMATCFNERPTDEQEAKRVRTILEGVSQGRPLSELDPKLDPATRIFVLGLAPNASRLAIRFWLVDSLGELTQRLAQHAQDLHLEPVPWRREPSVWQLALTTAPSRWDENKKRYQSKSEDVSPWLAGELMRSILTGKAYPLSLLSNIVMRFRADGHLSGLRIAICKAVLTRQKRLFPSHTHEEISVSLDTQSTQTAYVLGRLFAVLENIQRTALGKDLNATIRDRYYGAASATPASIFPLLVRNAQNHLSRTRKDNKGAFTNQEKLLGEIFSKLPPQFPRSFNIEEQGRFAIGYYHQYQANFPTQEKSQDTAATDDLQGESA